MAEILLGDAYERRGRFGRDFHVEPEGFGRIEVAKLSLGVRAPSVIVSFADQEDWPDNVIPATNYTELIDDVQDRRTAQWIVRASLFSMRNLNS